MATMKSKTFIEKAIDIAKNYNTLYVMGCFGAPLTGSNVSRYCTNHTYNKQSTRTAMIKAVADKDPPYYGFDCVCLIKGILWGWCGNSAKTYGGATYASNGVPDIGADSMIAKCSDISTTGWANMTPGEVCWLSGHIGIYIGDGLCVECTPSWDNKVQITAVKNIGTKSGYNARTWTKHGKLPYVDYSDQTATSSSASTTSSSTKAAAGSTADPKTIWDYLMGKIGNAYGVAGLMGNLYAESGLIPNNLQNTYNTKLGYTDAAYTAAVDDGSYSKFSSDSAGYGLAQWTYSTRKKNLKAYADAQNASIGNLEMQLGFLYKELSESYSPVLTTLKNATTVLQASNAVLTKFECPADQGSSVKSTRASYGQKYYDTYAGTESSTTDSSSSASSSTSTSTTSSTTTYKLAAAQSFDKSLAGTYTTKGAYNMRYVPGTLVSANVICVIPKGKTVRCYGYYTTVSGTKWLYVVYNGKTGFVTMEGLK